MPDSRRLAFLSFLALLLPGMVATAETHTDRIRLDQFGYPRHFTKIAVLADPLEGFDADEAYSPGSTIEVRLEPENTVVLTREPVPWGNGSVHTQSGDRVWWVDFTEVEEPGTYHLFDPQNGLRSDSFQIGDKVYHPVLRQAVRMYFYQRSGMAKEARFAGEAWADGAAFVGDNQDPGCRAVWDKDNPDLERNLSGGWFDAGDYNKYTEWAGKVVMELLLAYRQNPYVFDDNFNIPESGNGIPDLLDEVRWELDWLLRMQEPSGALLGKVSVTEHQAASPASSDDTPRYYGPVSTEATASGAAAFALGSMVYASVGEVVYALRLKEAALAAWEWCQANPEVAFDNTGFQSASPGRDDYGRLMNRLKAAIFLFALTGEPRFRDFVDANLSQAHPIQWGYFYGFEGQLQKALVFYAGWPEATPATAAAIRDRMVSSIGGSEFLPAYRDAVDAYRAYLKDNDYVWGSNSIKSQVGLIFLNLNRLGSLPGSAKDFRDAAAGYLHYLHGCNPNAMTMLTNMYGFGAERSANEMYHLWFGDGTPWDRVGDSPYGPPPGYLVGGPNRNFSADRGLTLAPPSGQPTQKSYRDWNTSWPENSWQVTEPAIYYQAAYIHLLSQLMPAGPVLRLDTGDDTTFPCLRVWSGSPDQEGPVETSRNLLDWQPMEQPLQPGWPWSSKEIVPGEAPLFFRLSPQD